MCAEEQLKSPKIIMRDPEQQPPDRDGTAYDHEDEAPRYFSWRYFMVALLINLGIAFVGWWIFWPR